MLSVVTDTAFDWGDDRAPDLAYHHTVIYEAHVKGLTKTHPGLPEEIRGTYAGAGHPALVEHLTSLGVTALELMPVHQFVQDPHLTERGLSNYWGYNTIGFFAPHNAYSSAGGRGQQVTEFKAMVKALHAAGIEVILDVVYNHTAEGNELGPTLSFKGIDNASYYRLVDDDPGHYFDTTGTGNSLLMRHPHVLQLIMDSLRYWVLDMHADGFRFDLAATLARQFAEVDKLSAFFDLVQQDPVISQVKLIAEPWDIGDGGYQVGNFPPLWTEWNGRYRDTVRNFWRGAEATLPEFASRLTGSADLYQSDRRRPLASINFVTAHDGFTLRDLVSYNDKHNDANGEDGQDGSDDNRSWNCGAEGESQDPQILALRARQQRNLLTTLLLSQGVPMIAHGDELGRTQQGNNNVYGQDNDLSWIDWDLDQPRQDLLAFTRQLVQLRRDHPVLRRRFFRGDAPDGSIGDLAWLLPDGNRMQDSDWHWDEAHAVGVFLNGQAITEPDREGDPVTDDCFLILLNGHHEAIEFRLPRGGVRREMAGHRGHVRRRGGQARAARARQRAHRGPQHPRPDPPVTAASPGQPSRWSARLGWELPPAESISTLGSRAHVAGRRPAGEARSSGSSASRLFLGRTLGELVLRGLVGDSPEGAILAEGQRPGPVEHGGYPVAPADQVKNVNESPHRVSDDSGELHSERVGHRGEVADGGHAAFVPVREGCRSRPSRQPGADQPPHIGALLDGRLGH